MSKDAIAAEQLQKAERSSRINRQAHLAADVNAQLFGHSWSAVLCVASMSESSSDTGA